MLAQLQIACLLTLNTEDNNTT
uniref:Uncharacterized protein n=1 Tax=Arundo donax TaxID=35708 RepID=A0A0A8Z7N0_ARUDO